MAAAHHHALETRGKEKMMRTATVKFKIVFLLMVLILVLGGVWGIAGLRAPSSRLVDFDYEIRIHDIPQGSRELKVWLPLLAQTPYQEIKNITIEPQEHTAIYYDPVYNNKILSYTVDIAQRDSLIFNVRYRVKRYEYSNKHGILKTVLAKPSCHAKRQNVTRSGGGLKRRLKKGPSSRGSSMARSRVVSLSM